MQDFIIRPAVDADVPAIMAVMQQSVAALQNPDWFVPDNEAYIRAHIDGPGGFCMVAQAADGELAAYFTIKLAGAAPDALGRLLGMDETALAATAQVDSSCVAPPYRGNSLEGKLLQAAEARMQTAAAPYRHYLGTVHPANAASLNTLLHRGYHIAAENLMCYGGKLRHILRKDMER